MYLIKFTLLTILFSTSSIIGILLSKRYSNRVVILKDMKNALNMFEVKMSFSFETIPEIFKEISLKYSGVVSKIFLTTVKLINENNMIVGEAWEKSLEINGGNLKKEDINCLKTLAKLLGRTDINGQVNQIELVNNFLERQINEAVESKNKNEKMYQKLGVIIGLVLVIVLI